MDPLGPLVLPSNKASSSMDLSPAKWTASKGMIHHIYQVYVITCLCGTYMGCIACLHRHLLRASRLLILRSESLYLDGFGSRPYRLSILILSWNRGAPTLFILSPPCLCNAYSLSTCVGISSCGISWARPVGSFLEIMSFSCWKYTSILS